MRGTPGNGAGQAAMLLLALAMAAAVAPAAAQTVQKCVTASGHVTLTSDACGAGERLVGSYAAVPEQAPPRAAAAERPAASPGASPRPRASRHAGSRGPAPAARRPRSGQDPCQAARERRDRTLRRVGLARTFDLLRRLDDDVREACR